MKMQGLDFLCQIPPEAKITKWYFYKACNQDVSAINRIAAIGMVVFCAMGNSIVYGARSVLQGVVIWFYWIRGDYKETFLSMQQNTADFCRSCLFPVKIITALIFSGLKPFRIICQTSKNLEGAELEEELLGFFNQDSTKVVDQIEKDITRETFLVNGKLITTLDDLKTVLDQNLIEKDHREKALSLLHQGFYAYGEKFIHKEVEAAFDCCEYIAHNEMLSERFRTRDIVIENRHIIVKGSIQKKIFHINDDPCFGLPFIVKYTYIVDLNFQSNKQSVHFESISFR
jgi:hypothetical protein